MTSFQPTPSQLAIRLTLYFAVFFGAMITMVSVWPDAMDNLPFGGHHALDFSEIKDETLTLAKPESGDEDSGGFTATFRQTTSSITKGSFVSIAAPERHDPADDPYNLDIYGDQA